MITVLKSDLQSVPESRLHQYFSDDDNLKTQLDGYVWVDRDPDSFVAMLDYLKSDRETH